MTSLASLNLRSVSRIVKVGSIGILPNFEVHYQFFMLLRFFSFIHIRYDLKAKAFAIPKVKSVKIFLNMKLEFRPSSYKQFLANHTIWKRR